MRLIGSAFARMEGGSGAGESIMTLDASEEEPLVTGEVERGDLKTDTGGARIRAREGRTKSGVRGMGMP